MKRGRFISVSWARPTGRRSKNGTTHRSPSCDIRKPTRRNFSGDGGSEGSNFPDLAFP
jgi:hypothetical protein